RKIGQAKHRRRLEAGVARLFFLRWPWNQAHSGEMLIEPARERVRSFVGATLFMSPVNGLRNHWELWFYKYFVPMGLGKLSLDVRLCSAICFPVMPSLTVGLLTLTESSPRHYRAWETLRTPADHVPGRSDPAARRSVS